jgi:hypothetical protein
MSPWLIELVASAALIAGIGLVAYLAYGLFTG